MTKMRYSGPGDSVQVDGVEIKRGEIVELSTDQARRIRESGGVVEEDTSDAQAPARERGASR